MVSFSSASDLLVRCSPSPRMPSPWALVLIALPLLRRPLMAVMDRLGFGSSAQTGFPGEVAGQLSDYRRWAQIDQATLAFGYGISVTTLQLAQAYQVLGADGERRPATLLRQAGEVRGE